MYTKGVLHAIGTHICYGVWWHAPPRNFFSLVTSYGAISCNLEVYIVSK